MKVVPTTAYMKYPAYGATGEIVMFEAIRRRQEGFTLIEIMIVIMILGLLLGIALPSVMHARMKTNASSCRENLRVIVSAKERWAMDNNKPSNATPTWGELVPIYLKGNKPLCPGGGTYDIGALNENPTCSLGGEHIVTN